jgi:hypothetical protein
MAIGRISGPLLKANLLREGVNLAFENDLIYLELSDADPANHKVGIKTTTPQYDLDVNGTARVPSLEVSTSATIGDVNITGTTISTTEPTLRLGAVDDIIYQKRLTIDKLDLENNVISTNDTNTNIEFSPNGTGSVEMFGDTNVYGSVYATGSITADGNITIGDADTDNVTFNAEISSDIVPDATNTYSLGSDPATGGKQWQNVWTDTLYAGTVTTSAIAVDGVDIALRQGNIWYVAENGNDTYSGDHPNDPYGSVKYAIENATSGETVHIYPGEYTEEFPITVPAGVTVKGHSIRGVKIVPTEETKYNDALLLNGESTVEDLTIADFYSGGNYFTTTGSAAGSATINVGTAPFAHTYVSGGTINIGGTDYAISAATYNESTGSVVITHAGGNAGIGVTVFVSGLIFSCNGGNRIFPDNGYAFRFATDFEVTTRSPYIRNVTVLTQGSVTSSSDPRGFDAGDAGKGAYVDGAYATANSREAGMLFHSVTFITPGVDALTATNGARIEWLNSFTYFANRGFYAFDSNEGIAGTGKTSIRVDGLTGTIVDGNTFTYYDTDGTTVLATGIINGVDADGKFYVNGNLTGLETAAARGGKTVVANGDAQLSTSVKKFGSASLALDGTGDYLEVAANNDFGFGTGDYTVEGQFYFNSVAAVTNLFDFRAGAGSDVAPLVYIDAGGQLRFYSYSADRITGATLTTGQWYHIAVSRSGNDTRLFLNGQLQGTWTVSPVDYGIAKPLVIGARWDGNNPFNGNIDEFRVTKGIARYIANFVAPLSEFTSDEDTKLLLHCNGSDTSTTIIDDTLNSQDLRFSNGATATYVTLADRTDFGAEVRSIASACVYGNYGVVGDGPGVLMYLISQNLAYIGVGKDVDNDDTSVIQANEIVELNDARIRYSSVDHKGDFRVGDLFYVNQEDGTVDFSSSVFNINTSDGVTITTGSSTTTITGDKIDTGNLRITGNTIQSLSGDINLDADSGTVRINSTSALQLPKGDTASRPTPATGMIRYNTDNDLFEGYDGNWIALNGVYDLDLDTRITAELTPGANDDIIRFYIADSVITTIDADKLETPRIEVDDISIDSNVITTETADTDLLLSANGTGSVVIDNLAFKDSTITNREENGILNFQQEGSGYFKIEGTNGFVVPVGTNVQRPPAAYRETGMVRYNTEQRYLEIWDGFSWVSVAGATGSISFAAAEDLAIEYVLTLG